MTPPIGLSRIGQIAIHARDVPRATAFYRDTLGMKFLFEAPNLAFFDCGGVRLMVGLPSEPRFDHPASILYYKVDDIQETHRELLSRGVTFEQPPHFVAKLLDHDLWLAFFQDSEGNLLGLMGEVRR